MVSEQGSDNGISHHNPIEQPMEETFQATKQQMLQIQRKMHEMFIQLQTQMDELSARRTGIGTSQQQSISQHTHGTIVPWVVRLDFPRYAGTDDPITWIEREEQFFAFHQTLVTEKVSLAAYHLERGVHLWFQSFRRTRV